MATIYIVQATSINATAEFSRKEYAIRQAEARAKVLGHAEAVVVLTGTGKEVFRTEVKEAPAPKVSRAARQRDAVAEAALPGWEVVYNKPRAGYQLWRSTTGTGWAIYRTATGELIEYPTMDSAKRAAWTPRKKTETPVEPTTDEVHNDLTPREMEALVAIHAGGSATQVWNPNAAAEASSVGVMRRLEELGLVELAVNDPDNIWAYITDLGERTLARK